MIPLGLVFGTTVGFVHLLLALCSTGLMRSVVTVIMMGRWIPGDRGQMLPRQQRTAALHWNDFTERDFPDPFESEVKGRHAGFGS